MIDWEKLFKIQIANANDKFHHHEVTKLLLVMKLLTKYSRNLNPIRIYTEYPIRIEDQLRICDIYFENTRKKEIYLFEIQRKFTDESRRKSESFYQEVQTTSPLIKTNLAKTIDWIPIDLDKLSTDITILNEELDEFIV